ncbi:translation initiation factor IF-2-like [Equus quagga]|uniref:translation initiation factor IF-2-like n=1 Tax=Equus quagga TaxID=89248 RepID=UPI001EE1DFED|nr:translation initiation factor IF-2-like [Equus quagga]
MQCQLAMPFYPYTVTTKRQQLNSKLRESSQRAGLRQHQPGARTPAPRPAATARSGPQSPLPGPGLGTRRRRPCSPLHPLRSPLQGRARGAVSPRSARRAAAPVPAALGPAPRGPGAALAPSRSSRARGSSTALLSRRLRPPPRTPTLLTSRPELGASRRSPPAAASPASSGPAPAAEAAAAAPAQALEPPPRRTFSGARHAQRARPRREGARARGRESARAQGAGRGAGARRQHERAAGGGASAAPGRGRAGGPSSLRAPPPAAGRDPPPSSPGGSGSAGETCPLRASLAGWRRAAEVRLSFTGICPASWMSARRDYKERHTKQGNSDAAFQNFLKTRKEEARILETT